MFAGWIPIMPYYLPSTPSATIVSYRPGWATLWPRPIRDINTTDPTSSLSVSPLLPSLSILRFGSLCVPRVMFPVFRG